MGKSTGRAGGASRFLRRNQGTMLFFVGLMGMLWFGWRVFPPLLYSSTEQPFQFSHAVHSGEAAGMSCADCHPFRDDGSFVGLPPLSVCLDCHEEAIGETRQERIFIEKYVTPRKEVPWLVYSRQPMNAYFSHAAHVTTAKFTCEECHGEHGTSESIPPYQVNRISGYSRAIGGASSAGRAVLPTEVMRMDTCANCHVKHGRNSPCLECHK